MRFVLFYHSLISDWNHGNAHFLRGIVRALSTRGHQVTVYEPANGWSLTQLRRECGQAALTDFAAAYPGLKPKFYDRRTINLDRVLTHADVVIVHEWTDPDLIARIGRHRLDHHYSLLFHDTHHRAVSRADEMAALDLSGYDGVLAFGAALTEIYRRHGWGERVWTWHEAADTETFYPRRRKGRARDLVWIGNWGDDERSRELEEFLVEPVERLHLKSDVYGVRYPEDARARLARARIAYRGWVANYRAPEVFARFRATVHVPRRFYRDVLPGIPTIRVFEALACGIPLVSAPWSDDEGLFRTGTDYLTAANGTDMVDRLDRLMKDAALRDELARNGRDTIMARHTCGHRADELMAILGRLGSGQRRHGRVPA